MKKHPWIPTADIVAEQEQTEVNKQTIVIYESIRARFFDRLDAPTGAHVGHASSYAAGFRDALKAVAEYRSGSGPAMAAASSSCADVVGEFIDRMATRKGKDR